jgi:lysophospholipase L1-like esterase
MNPQEKQGIRKKTSPKKLWSYRIGIFAAFFVLVEIILRLTGYSPGVIDEFYYHKGDVVYDPVILGSEEGISTFNPNTVPFSGGIINQQGFYSNIPFTKPSIDSVRAGGKKIVFLVGDSFTHGCCAENYQQSFAGILSESDTYEILNFGIPGTDPLQYRAIVEKYAPLFEPDLILTAVYTGNDIMDYDRKLTPHVPFVYPVRNGPWLNSEGPFYLTEKGTVFKNFDEAKTHYFTYFSLWSDQSSFFEKVIRYSVMLSRPYLKLKTKKQYLKVQSQMPQIVDEPDFSRKHLERIKIFSDSLGIKTVFTLIQTPGEAEDKIDLIHKYGFLFGKLEWEKLDDLELKHYDGPSDGNHFNNYGHKKYAALLSSLIAAKLE